MNLDNVLVVSFETLVESVRHISMDPEKIRILILISKTDKPHYVTNWDGKVLKVNPPVRMTCPLDSVEFPCNNKIATEFDPLSALSACFRCRAVVCAVDKGRIFSD